ncbi:MAG: HAMP domain-containing histidine kinase [Serpentinimonas sp.]|nr:HAMP domain-containing histidine kinase [Serpentinimonas sp.]
MFRRQLQLAWGAVALLALSQGAVSWWAIQGAARKVEHGRVASDLLGGFQQLALTKQALREWLANALLTQSYEDSERLALLQRMQDTLRQLEQLAVQARGLDPQPGGLAARVHEERARSLQALGTSLTELDAATRRIVAGIGPDTGADTAASPGAASQAGGAPAGLTPGQAWDQTQDLLALSEGERLPALLAESAAREREAVAQKRTDADQSLQLLLLLALGATVFLSLVCAWLASHFGRALSAPLERLTLGVEALQRGDLSHRIDEVGRDEFARVAQRVNLMATELERHRAGEILSRQQLEALVSARTAELQQALDALQQMDGRRRQLFADIGHELRTPTTAIRGEAEIALRGSSKSALEYQDSLGRIADAARHLGGVIDDLLTLARAEADTLTLHRQPVQGAELLGQALRQVDALARERQVEVELQADTEDAPLLADPQRLRQLLVVVLDNAVRYSRPGGHILVTSGVQAGGEWRVCVADQGIGVAPADLPQVFERHFRSEAARRHRADGSGLGLSIGRLLAEAHGGRIALQSEEHVGTTVTLWLPLAEPDLIAPEGDLHGFADR